MNAHRIETTLSESRTLTLENLPFSAGANLEIIVLERDEQNSSRPTFPLRGTTARYDAPFDPAAPDEDWDVLR